MDTIGERFKYWRNYIRLSQVELGRIAKVTRQQVSRAEKGDNFFSRDSLIRLKKEFPELNLNWLIAGQEPMLIDFNTVTRREHLELERKYSKTLEELLNLKREYDKLKGK